MAKTTQLSQHRRWCSCEEESHSVQDTGPEDWVAWPGMYNWVETTQRSQDPALLCHYLPARHALSPHQSMHGLPCRFTTYPAGSRLSRAPQEAPSSDKSQQAAPCLLLSRSSVEGKGKAKAFALSIICARCSLPTPTHFSFFFFLLFLFFAIGFLCSFRT